MPRSVRTRLFAAVLLAATMAGAPARAEMTEADKAEMRTFAECLDEAGDDEAGCIEKLGRLAWYPRDDAACEAVATRIRSALSEGGQAEHKDLFFNERCTRLEMPHHREAAKAGDAIESTSPYRTCMNDTGNAFQCEKTVARHSAHPLSNNECKKGKHFI